MTGRAHWLLLRESLVALHRSWQTLPQLIVVSDGSWQAEEFNAAFDFWPEPIQVMMPEDIIAPLTRARQTDLVELARQHPLGLKLAAIISQARQHEILFVDSDILWFADPSQILAGLKGLGGPSVTVENGCSYNEELLKLHAPEALAKPGINTGCVHLDGELCEREFLAAMLATALQQPKHNFNEQSIIAAAVQKHGRRLPPEFCLVDFADARTWKRRKPWREGFYARHYVNFMRHQFHRDARALRCMSA